MCPSTSIKINAEGEGSKWSRSEIFIGEEHLYITKAFIFYDLIYCLDNIQAFI